MSIQYYYIASDFSKKYLPPKLEKIDRLLNDSILISNLVKQITSHFLNTELPNINQKSFLPIDIIQYILTLTGEPNRAEQVCKEWKELSDKTYESFFKTLIIEKGIVGNKIFTAIESATSYKKKWLTLMQWAKDEEKTYKMINISPEKIDGHSAFERINQLISFHLNPLQNFSHR